MQKLYIFLHTAAQCTVRILCLVTIVYLYDSIDTFYELHIQSVTEGPDK